MENFKNHGVPFLALVAEGNIGHPDRRAQDMGTLLANATESKNTDVLFAVAQDGLARATLSSVMIGYGPTATFEPDQIRRPMALDVPEQDGLDALMAIIEANRRRGTEGVAGKADARKPRKAVIVITNGAFIQAFLRFYFSTVANGPETPSLDEFVSFGTSVVINTITHEVKILQA